MVSTTGVTYEILGAVSATEMFTTARPVPPGPVAMIVSFVAAVIAVGVPEMMPEEAFNERPAGSGVEPAIA